jgi:hypothetical protein
MDGKFADVLAKSDHALHPRTPFEFPEDFDDEELLVQRCQELNSVLAARQTSPARFPVSEVVSRLRALREVSDRALAFWDEEEQRESARLDAFRLLRAYQKQARWVLKDGEASAYDVAVRFVVFVWLFFPDITRARNQVELLRHVGLKDKQQFNRLLIECSEQFQYRNPSMRDAEAVESFKKAAGRRMDWEEFLHGCFASAMQKVNEAQAMLADRSEVAS